MRLWAIGLVCMGCTQPGATPDCTQAQCGPDLDATIVDVRSDSMAVDGSSEASTEAGTDAGTDAAQDAPKDSTGG